MGKTVLAAACVLGLAGCADLHQAQVNATEQARNHCISEGKQFILLDTKVNGAGDIFADKSVMVTGNCVGPGEPGYVPPAKSGS